MVHVHGHNTGPVRNWSTSSRGPRGEWLQGVGFEDLQNGLSQNMPCHKPFNLPNSFWLFESTRKFLDHQKRKKKRKTDCGCGLCSSNLSRKSKYTQIYQPQLSRNVQRNTPRSAAKMRITHRISCLGRLVLGTTYTDATMLCKQCRFAE